MSGVGANFKGVNRNKETKSIMLGIDPYKEDAEIKESNKGSNSDFNESLKNVQKLYDESIINDLINYKPKLKVEVKIVSDGDHAYIIPACMKREFEDLLFEAELTEDISKFTEWFGKYCKNPDDLKLYTDEI